ncbi:hypothetical protein [Aquimarina rhabdastrellae]
MAEELYFFKIDEDVVRERLPQVLSENGISSYQNFIAEHPYYSNGKSNNYVDYNEIITKIENDIAQLTKNEFWTICNWFYNKNELSYSHLGYKVFEEKTDIEMRGCGIILFEEITSKTIVRKFHKVLNDYEIHLKKWLEFKTTHKEIELFLNYLICYTGELSLLLNKIYDEDNSKENIEIREEIKNIKTTDSSFYHDLALIQIEEEKPFIEETIALSNELTAYGKDTKIRIGMPPDVTAISKRKDELLTLANLFYFGIRLKKDITEYQGFVFRLHSY